MMRLLILVSLGVIVVANSIPSYIQNYPRGLERLFSAKRQVTAEKKKNERSLCQTEECKLIANVMKESMDESADPCDDFYQYACGNWADSNPVPENRTSWSLWEMVQDKIEMQVKAIIETEAKPTDMFAVKLSKKWYKSCMDTEAEARRGVEPILSTVWRHGGWPLIMEDGEWDDRVYNWQIVDDHFARLLGLNSFHDVNYGRVTYEGNGTIVLDTPHLPLHLYRILSDDEVHPSSDTSDENNESGEGSQERGSKEKGKPNEDEDDESEESEETEEDNEIDEGSSEEATGEGEVEETRKKKVARRKLHKRLGRSRKHSNKIKVARTHIGEVGTRRRTKRDAVRAKVLHRMLHKVKKQGKRGVHHSTKKTKGRQSKHSHLSVPNKRNNPKNDKREETVNNNIAHGKKDVHRKDREHDEAKEEQKAAGWKISKRLGHSTRKNKKNKAAGKQVHERKVEENSKRATMNTKLHNNKHHAQRKISNRRNHPVVQINGDAESGGETEEEDNSADNDNNEVEDEENAGDSEDKDEDDDGKDKDEDDDSKDKDEDEEENDTDSAAEDSDEGDDDEEDSGNKDDDDEDDGEDDEDDENDENERDVEELREEYRNYILNVSLVLSKGRGIEVPREKLEKDIANLVEFAIKVGELTLQDGEPVNATLDSLQETYDDFGPPTKNSKINWKRKIMKMFAEAGVDIEEDVDIVVACPTYLRNLHSLLSETPSETIVNYIHWLFINKMILFTAPELQKLAEGWYGKPYYTSRTDQCIEQVEMSEIIGYEYVSKHFSDEIAKTARDMVDDIQKEVEYQIKESTWMDGDTKHFILDKLVTMKNWVGYPNWYHNTTLLKSYFQGLTVGPSYYENVLNYFRYLKWKRLRKIVEDDALYLDLMEPLIVNAFFMPTENSISITAADFQSPFFALNRPWNINYGILGVIMGHEVNHGFDDSGHLYDREGKPMEWLAAMAAAYDQRAECFVDQFNNYSLIKGENYTVEDYGIRTAGENIADTMGLQAAYRAYLRRERHCEKPDPALPGLEEFNNDKMFFLSFANVWCDNEDRESVMMSVKYDVHSTGRLRVIGSVSNSEDFAKVYNCPVGSRMNPEKKCNIWI